MYDELGSISSHVQEIGRAASARLKVYNNQTHEQARFGDRIERYRDAGMQRAWLDAPPSSRASRSASGSA